MMLRLGIILGLALSASSSPSAASPGAGGPAPAFSLPRLAAARDTISLKTLQGRPVLVDFWASWCPPCRKSLPRLAALRARHPSLAIVAIGIDEDRAKAWDFVKRMDTAVIFLHDAERKAAAAYDPGGMPSLYLIDGKGALRYRHDGYTEGDMAAIEGEITGLTGGK